MLYPPHCGDSRMSHRCARRTLPDYLFMVSYYWNIGNKTVRYSIIYIGLLIRQNHASRINSYIRISKKPKQNSQNLIRSSEGGLS